MKVVGMVINLDKLPDSGLVHGIVQWLEERGCTLLIEEGTAVAVGLPRLGVSEEVFLARAQWVIVLGGDGTLLQSTRQLAQAVKPVIGINLGRLGFLTEVDIPEVFPALERVLAGDFRIEERMMLEALVYRDGQVVEQAFGLNEAAITSDAYVRLFYLEAYVNDEYVHTYPANGLIIASPTGSTAYSLSAGGPLITPELNLMLITPVCPHSLWSRPLVVSPESTVRVKFLTTGQEEVMVTMDGQYGFPLLPTDEVLVRQAVPKARFIRFRERGFFDLLRKKLRE